MEMFEENVLGEQLPEEQPVEEVVETNEVDVEIEDAHDHPVYEVIECEDEEEDDVEVELFVEKPKSKVGFIVAALVVIAVILTGVFVIQNTPMKRLVGVWDMKYNGATYMLSSDEQLFINGMNYGTYVATSDTLTIHLDAQDGEETPEPIVFTYSHDGDMLILEKKNDVDASMIFGFELETETSIVFTRAN